jgi:hypothetical protein
MMMMMGIFRLSSIVEMHFENGVMLWFSLVFFGQEPRELNCSLFNNASSSDILHSVKWRDDNWSSEGNILEIWT